MATEYESLSDLVLARGNEHSEVLAKIHQAVLARYVEQYPKASISARVVVDEHTGLVRIFDGNKDVTPKTFEDEASSIARQVLISLLSTAETETKTKSLANRGSLVTWILRIVFWGYNFYFIFILFLFSLGFLDTLFSDGLLKGLVELGVYKSVLLILLVLTPLLSIGMVLARKGRVTNRFLARTFFFFEMPVVFLSIILFQAIQAPSGAITLLLLLLLLTPFGLFFFNRMEKAGKSWKLLLAHGFLEWLYLALIYASLLFTFLAPLVLGAIARFAFDDVVRNMASLAGGGRYFSPFDFVGFSIQLGLGMLAFLAVVGLIGLPFGLVWRFTKMLSASMAKIATYFSAVFAKKISVVVAMVWLVTVAGLAYQPNANTFIDALRQLETATTFNEKERIAQELIPQEKRIKQALQDMYNARRRFFFTPKDDFLADGYEQVFGLPESWAGYIQRTFHLLGYPLVYHGPEDENGEAARAFTYLFGDSIKESETSSTTPNRQVLVKNRVIEVLPDKEGLFATVSFEEEYENKSSTQQEVIYEFSLPEHAVIQSLALGPDLEFEGQFAPAGAAQQTYERELRQRRDPALLTQIGPGNYRLRVFPIPGVNDMTTLRGRNQRVRFSYVVALSERGYALPVFTRQSNIAEKPTNSNLSVNGVRVSYDSAAAFAPAENSGKQLCQASVLATYKQQDEDMDVRLEPVSKCGEAVVSLMDLVGQGKKLAVLFDVSYPNKNEPLFAELKETLAENRRLLDQNEVDFYRYNDLLSTGVRLVPEALESQLSPVYFGTPNLSKALLDLQGKDYDLVIVASGNEKQSSKLSQRQMNVPVYFVTPNAGMPLADQQWKVLIQDGVYTARTLKEAFRHYGRVNQASQLVDKVAPLVTDYWMLTLDMDLEAKPRVSAALAQVDTAQERLIMPGAPLPPIEPFPTPPQPTFTPKPTPTPRVIPDPWEYVELNEESVFDSVAAKAVWWQRVRNQKGTLSSNMTFLDKAHDFAQKTRIVTPFTALIALVNQQQQQNLDQFSQDWNRYQTQDPLEFVQPPVFRDFQVGPSFGGVFGMNKSIEAMPMALDGTESNIMAEAPSYQMSLNSPALLFVVLNALLIGGVTVVLLVRFLLNKRQAKR